MSTTTTLELLSELEAAHKIIQNALILMNMDQRVEWAKMNDRDGASGEGITRFHERLDVLIKARQVASAAPSC